MTPEERFDTALSDLKQASDNYVQSIIEYRREERRRTRLRRFYRAFQVITFLNMVGFIHMVGRENTFKSPLYAGIVIFLALVVVVINGLREAV